MGFNNRSEPAAEKHDKYLQNVLVCPAYNAETFKKGDHLKGEPNELKMNTWGSNDYNKIKQQNNARFHYLEQNEALQVPQLVVDFKHYYTIPRDVIYKMHVDNYLATFNKLFRESLSQRFSSYLSRIGLPEIKEKIDAKTASSMASTSSVIPQPSFFDRSQCDEER